MEAARTLLQASLELKHALYTNIYWFIYFKEEEKKEAAGGRKMKEEKEGEIWKKEEGAKRRSRKERSMWEHNSHITMFLHISKVSLYHSKVIKQKEDGLAYHSDKEAPIWPVSLT